MAIFRGPYQGQGYIYDGVILSLDAANPDSYPGTGTIWYDLSPLGNNIELFVGLTTTEIGGVVAMNIDIDGKYAAGDCAGQAAGDSTMESWYYPSAVDTPGGTDTTATIIQTPGGNAKYHVFGRSNRKLYTYSYGTSPAGYHFTGASVPREVWCHMVSAYDLDNSKLYQWTNGVKTSVTTSGSPTASTGVSIGRQTANRQLAGGVSVIRIYNRALTDEEVLFNFNNSRRRFGI